MASLGFIEGVAFAAIVAGADGRNQPQSSFSLAFVELVHRGGVLEAGHDLVVIGKGPAWPAAPRVGGHEHGAFIAEGIGAAVVEVAPQIGLEIVLGERTQSGFDMFLVQ